MSSLNACIHDLTAPFTSDLIDLKPGALTRTRDRALALPYADSRVYHDRLDQVIGPEGWSVHFSLHATGAICTLTILGVTKADVGDIPLDYDPDRPNENRATTAAAQAFKRACAQFGLGRYLYHLPRTWADYDPEQRAFVDPSRVIATLYHAAGLAAYLEESPTPSPARTTLASPDPQRMTQARTALAEAEQRTAGGIPNPATDAQLGLIARLLITFQQAEDAADLAEAVNTIGERAQIHDLATLTRKDALRAQAITKPMASALIEALKALETPQLA